MMSDELLDTICGVERKKEAPKCADELRSPSQLENVQQQRAAAAFQHLLAHGTLPADYVKSVLGDQSILVSKQPRFVVADRDWVVTRWNEPSTPKPIEFPKDEQGVYIAGSRVGKSRKRSR